MTPENLKKWETKQLEFTKSIIDYYFGGTVKVKVDGDWLYPGQYLKTIGILDENGDLIVSQKGFVRQEAVKYFEELSK